MSLKGAVSTMFQMTDFLMAFLEHALGTVGATNRLHMVVALFGMTIVPCFLGLLGTKDLRELASFILMVCD